MEKVSCTKCGKEVFATNKFCTACGTQVPEQGAGERPLFCAKCGKEMPEASKFCTACGAQASGQGGSTSASQPQEDLSLFGYYQKCFKNFAVFKGRAKRKEYWGFMLFNFIICFVLGLVSMAVLLPIVVYGLVSFIPSLAVMARRLHDTGRPLAGWRALVVVATCIIDCIPAVAGVGALIFLPFLIAWGWTDSQPGANQYGPNPKGM